MAASSTYTPIATTTLGSTQASVSFSSFAGYTDLVLITNVTWLNTTNLFLTINGDSGTNYSNTILVGNGTTAVSDRQSNQIRFSMGYNGTAAGNGIVHEVYFMNYANTSVNKTVLIKVTNPTNDVIRQVGLYRSLSSITSITLNPQIGDFASGSTFTLYGISAA